SHPDVSGQLHALRCVVARPVAARNAGQIVVRVRRRPRFWVALSMSRSIRRAAPELDEARVAPAAWTSMGVRLLRGRRCCGRCTGDGGRARRVESARDVHAAAGDVRSGTQANFTVMEPTGLEPVTFWLPARRSPN